MSLINPAKVAGSFYGARQHQWGKNNMNLRCCFAPFQGTPEAFSPSAGGYLSEENTKISLPLKKNRYL